MFWEKTIVENLDTDGNKEKTVTWAIMAFLAFAVWTVRAVRFRVILRTRPRSEPRLLRFSRSAF